MNTNLLVQRHKARRFKRKGVGAGANDAKSYAKLCAAKYLPRGFAGRTGKKLGVLEVVMSDGTRKFFSLQFIMVAWANPASLADVYSDDDDCYDYMASRAAGSNNGKLSDALQIARNQKK